VNARQKLFVAEYLKLRNARAAAEAAGYAPARAKQTGWRLLQNPAVASAISKADLERRARLGVDADWIVDTIVNVIEKAAGEKPVVTEEIIPGDSTRFVFEFQPAAALRGLEMLMKHLGIAGAERSEVSVSGEVVYTLTLDRELPTVDDDEEGSET
jgi:phage terminase small subunit